MVTEVHQLVHLCDRMSFPCPDPPPVLDWQYWVTFVPSFTAAHATPHTLFPIFFCILFFCLLTPFLQNCYLDKSAGSFFEEGRIGGDILKSGALKLEVKQIKSPSESLTQDKPDATT